MTDSSFIEEVTPVLGEKIQSDSVVSNSAVENNSWEEEKTILLEDDPNAIDKLWLQNLDTGENVEINSYPFTIGRSADADLSTQHNSVSRKHAIINKTDDNSRYVIEDLGSSNGIKVNGLKTSKVILNSGDSIDIGNLKFKFHIEEYPDESTQVKHFKEHKKSFSEILHAYKKYSQFDKKKVYAIAAAGLLALFSIYFFTVGSRVKTVSVTDKSIVDTKIDVSARTSSNKQTSPQTKTVSEVDKDTSNITDDNKPALTESNTDLVNPSGERSAQDPSATIVSTESTEIKIETESEVENPTLVTEKLVPELNTEEAPAIKKVIRRSSAWSEKYIQDSLNMYLEGNADAGIRRLGILSRSARHQRKYRTQSAALAKQLQGLQKQYLLGKSLSQQGDRNAAFNTWQKFLVVENNIFPNKSSSYTQDIQSEVAVEYTASGNRARLEGRWHDAYNLWKKASSILPTGEAANALKELEERAKQVYLDAYLQEKVNIQTASALWREVITLVPSGTEYHTKAKAKLKLYENYGEK